jgi:GrpB-like predicted nucleotidyltransferase (UPF0157 family)
MKPTKPEPFVSTQRVYLEPCDPRWPEEFARESAAVAGALGDVLFTIHHIGSTAIPGISAKPIIDMLAVVSDIAALDGRVEKMEAMGYEAMGEFGMVGRRYFRKDNAAGMRTHQVHAFQIGSPEIQRHLAFRDFMRAHPDCAERYDALKRRLAELHPSDVAAYTDGKDEFIAAMDARAAAWLRARSA